MKLFTPKWPGLILAAALLTACSGNLREVIGEPPQTSLHGLARNGEAVIVEIALRNVNDAPLSLAAARLTLELDGQPLIDGGKDLELTISARGREVIRFNLPANPAGMERLDALGGGSVHRLPWTMTVKLSLAAGGERTTRADGWLHRVPGQDNRFR